MFLAQHLTRLWRQICTVRNYRRKVSTLEAAGSRAIRPSAHRLDDNFRSSSSSDDDRRQVFGLITFGDRQNIPEFISFADRSKVFESLLEVMSPDLRHPGFPATSMLSGKRAKSCLHFIRGVHLYIIIGIMIMFPRSNMPAPKRECYFLSGISQIGLFLCRGTLLIPKRTCTEVIKIGKISSVHHLHYRHLRFWRKSFQPYQSGNWSVKPSHLSTYCVINGQVSNPNPGGYVVKAGTIIFIFSAGS